MNSSPVQPSHSSGSLQSLPQFMNANLIQQKRLKANYSQISMAAKEFTSLKPQYASALTVPPSTTSAARAQMYSNLRRLCNRYDSLLELRREMLQMHLEWLEEAVDAPALKDSAQVLLAIEMQIEAAKELAAMQKEGRLKKELQALLRSH